MTITINTLRALARSGQIIATEHGVYRDHDGVTEYADSPASGYRWDGTVDARPCPLDCAYLDIGRELVDSDTQEPVSAEDLGITPLTYHATIVESLLEVTGTGHVEVSGRSVYAA